MGCGHSKINIYPRKSKTKHGSSKKSASLEKAESEEEDGIEKEVETNENTDEAKKSTKVKSFGGPISAQIEISTSQQDFFKMLDEKIQNGPDYNSESESEKMAENARVYALLKDWETASAGSKSLPSTPKKRQGDQGRASEMSPLVHEVSRVPNEVRGHPLVTHQVPVYHQSYGIVPPQEPPYPPHLTYRQVTYNNTNYVKPQASPYYPAPAYPPTKSYESANPAYPPVQGRSLPTYKQYDYSLKTYLNSAGLVSTFKPNYLASSSYDPSVTYSPPHRMYTPLVSKPMPSYSNGEILQPKPTSQTQYHQQYKEARELLIQGQQGFHEVYRQSP